MDTLVTQRSVLQIMSLLDKVNFGGAIAVLDAIPSGEITAGCRQAEEWPQEAPTCKFQTMLGAKLGKCPRGSEHAIF